MKAVWQETVIADSDDIIVLEGDVYFPPESVNARFLEESHTLSSSDSKGDAMYYNLVIGRERAEDGAWSYLAPTEQARHIQHYIAFWKGVEIR